MPPKWMPPDIHDLVGQYAAGVSENALAEHFGVSRPVIRRVLLEEGVTRRGSLNANRVMMATRTKEENQRNSAAAHAAVRGKKRTAEELAKRAATREARGLNISSNELLLATWLHAVTHHTWTGGYASVPQKAVGPYNVDLAVEPVAVEIYGGGWHKSGRHAAREGKRFRYLLDAGWNILVVWVDRRAHPLRVEVVEEVVAFVEESRRDPAFRRQKRMIWGDGKPYSPRRFKNR